MRLATYMIPDNNTVNSCPALGGGPVPRPPQTFGELQIAAGDDKGAKLEVLPCTARYTHTMPFPARPIFSVAPRAPSMATLAVLESALSGLRISTTGSQVWRRHASHQAQGRANKAADGAGKRLGAKKSGGEYVVPGNILFKQRGTLWFPGDNCSMVCSGKVVQHARQG
jgi:ribosomal protein L27